jgi:hypothetical protein
MKSLARKYNYVYEKEVDNHIALKSAAGVIRYLGSFRHPLWPAYENDPTDADLNEPQTTLSCHIFLEYGVGDLLDLFGLSPPSFPEEIRNFWQDLSHLAKALTEIHDLKIGDQKIGV